MTRLARPPAPESDGGFTNQTMIPVTNAEIAIALPARFLAMYPRGWPKWMASRETIWFVPMLVIRLLVAVSLTIFLPPAIGVPLLRIAAIIGAFGFSGGRSGWTADMGRFREQAGSDTEFTARARESLTPSESAPARQ